MPQPLTQEVALQRAKDAHGDLYDLSELVYKGKLGLVKVHCTKHSWFEIPYRNFTRKVNPSGCQKCSWEKYLEDKVAWNIVSKEEAEKRLLEKFKGIYTFDMDTYKSFSKPLNVNCTEHGDFEESPSNMCNMGKGCPDCGKLISVKKRTKDIKTRKDEAIAKYGNLYDYSEINGKISSKENFYITCTKHFNRFETTWNRHLVKEGSGGCQDCRRENMRKLHLHSTEDFIRISKANHTTKYDYSRAIYIDHKSLVEIGCYVHGFFWQRADKHKIGQGCDKCVKNGYRNDKPGNLYVLQEGLRVKVGITNRKVKTRLSEVNIGGGQFEIVDSFFYEEGIECRNTETDLLKFMRNFYKSTEGTFDGVTESFEDVDISLVLEFIREKRKTYAEKNTQSMGSGV